VGGAADVARCADGLAGDFAEIFPAVLAAVGGRARRRA
jgi:hypothetical protein